MKKPNCSAAKADVSEGETFYVCSDSSSPCYQNLCNPDMCVSDLDDDPVDSGDCMFKDYYGLCQNDDTYSHGDYCSGRCEFFERK